MVIKNKLSEDYKAHTRQLSLGKLFSMLEIQPTPMQDGIIHLWDENLDAFSEVNIAASRRQGKTFTAAILIIRELLVVNSSTMVLSKSAKSVGVLFNEILRLLRVLGLKPTKVNSNQYSLQLNDSILRCTVHKTMETLLGNKASLIVLDEAGVYAYTDDTDINIMPMRNDFGIYENTKQFVAKVLRISSPREIGSDFYYDFLKGTDNKPKNLGKGDVWISDKGVCSMAFSIYDSPLVAPELIDALKATTEKEVFATEFLATFIHMNSISAFNMFNPETNTFNLPKLIKSIGGGTLESLGWEALGNNSQRFKGFLGLDVGYRDNSAIIVGTILDNKIYILDSFAKSYMTSKEYAEEIQNMINKWSSGTFPLDFDEGANYIDPSAALMSADLTNTYDIPVLPGFNKVRDGISLMNTAFRNQELMINEDLTELIDQVSMLAYKESIIGSVNKSSGDPFVRVKGHHFDSAHALRYLVTSLQQYWGVARSDDW